MHMKEVLDGLDIATKSLGIFTMIVTLPSIFVSTSLGVVRLCQIYKIQKEAEKKRTTGA